MTVRDLSFLNQLTILKVALLNSAVGQLSHALPIQLIVFIHALIYCSVRVRHFSHSVELVVFEDAFKHLTLYRYRTRLSIQIMILEMALAKLLLIDVIAKAV
jgi:hypothetical protein